MFRSSSRQKEKKTFEEEYKLIVEHTAGTGRYLPLLQEKGKKVADCEVQLRSSGPIHHLHKIILAASFGIDVESSKFALLAQKLALTEQEETLLLPLLYFAELPSECPFQLLEAVKLFVRIHY
jgi:hypothetical protein